MATDDSDTLRAECARELRWLDHLIPTPWDVDVFLARLGDYRGRPITLMLADLDPDAPCGLALGMVDGDVIVVPATASGYYRQHVTAHEVAHLLLDFDDAEQRPDHGLLGALLPDIPADLVKALFGRGSYSSAVERRAEVFADMLLERIESGASREPDPSALTTEERRIAARLSRTLRSPRRPNPS